jgi:hypothetical protein
MVVTEQATVLSSTTAIDETRNARALHLKSPAVRRCSQVFSSVEGSMQLLLTCMLDVNCVATAASANALHFARIS